MIDSYERRVFLTMLACDEWMTPSSVLLYGRASWDRFLRGRRRRSLRLPRSCHCGYTCPGPFMEMHDCLGDEGEEGRQ